MPVTNLFSTSLPKLQIAWDATSLGALMFCPRYYQQSILEGYRSKNNEHLEFGGYYASCVELYKKGRLDGLSKEQATIVALRYAITETWGWSGEYAEQWHCCGTKPYRNGKGNRAKCPWAHKGDWFPGPAPSECGTCSSPIKVQEQWVTSVTKDRYALIRLVAAYCDAQSNEPSDGPFPFAFPDGLPAVELSFKLPLEYAITPDGEPYILAGHMDSIMQLGEEFFITDNKTTGKSLGRRFYASYSPNIQMDLYDVIGSVLWSTLNIQGILIEGASVQKTGGVEVGYGLLYRTEEQREEFLNELPMWFKQAEEYARHDYWPMNRRNCFLCDFKEVCALAPHKRQMILDRDFTKRFWNPLEER